MANIRSAAICEFQNLFALYASAVSYTINNAFAGLAYSGDFAAFARYSTGLNSSRRFFSFAGRGLSSLSESPDYAPLLVHPEQADFSSTSSFYSHGGMTLDCISQLSVTVANSWKGNWTAKSPALDSEIER